jgi:hypothetical protein
VAFLTRHNLMDYSVLIRTHRVAPPTIAPEDERPALVAARDALAQLAAAAAAAYASGRVGGHGAPGAAIACETADGSTWLVEVGVIDYLQV